MNFVSESGSIKNIGQQAQQLLRTPKIEKPLPPPSGVAYEKIRANRQLIIDMANQGHAIPEIADELKVGHTTLRRHAKEVCGETIANRLRENGEIANKKRRSAK